MGGVLSDLDTDASPADPLRARFQGRRAWRRVRCTRAVRLRGADGAPYAGQTVDVSRSGVLVTLTDRAFHADGERDGIALIEERFPDGAELTFAEGGVRRKATIVRITLEHGAQLALGCAFDAPLTKTEALAVGIVAGETGEEEAEARSLPFVPRPGVALSLVLLGASESVVGPFALGRVQAVGERAIEATFDRPADAVAASCKVEPFTTLLVIGRERVWAGKGTLVACMPELPGSRVRVLVEGKLGRAVRKRVQPAAG